MSFIVSCAVISNHNNGVGKLLVIYPLLKHFRSSPAKYVSAVAGRPPRTFYDSDKYRQVD